MLSYRMFSNDFTSTKICALIYKIESDVIGTSLTSSFDNKSHDECNAANQTHKTPGGCKKGIQRKCANLSKLYSFLPEHVLSLSTCKFGNTADSNYLNSTTMLEIHVQII